MVEDISQKVTVDSNDTWLNPAITTKQQLIDWVLTMLGYPLIQVELSEHQLNACIANAVNIYSKYAYTPEKYLIVNAKFYEPGVGLDLAEFNISSIKSISSRRDRMFSAGDMFFGPYAFVNAGGTGGYPFFGTGGSSVGNWTTFQLCHEFFDLSKRMTGSNPDFLYDKTTKTLKLMPEPRHDDQDKPLLLTCEIEQPLSEYFGNEYVRRLVLAEAKILLGTIRKKFSSVQLLGGGTIDTSIGDEGREEKAALLEELMKTESKGQFYCIS